MTMTKGRCAKVYTLIALALLITCIAAQANAQIPKFSIIPQNGSSVVLGTATESITYIVTRNLPALNPAITPTLYPVPGLTQVTSGIGACPSPLSTLNQAGDSCLLTLSIDRNQFYVGQTITLIAPKICIGTSQLSCSQPSAADLLKITVLPLETLTISAPTLTLAQAGIFTAASGAGGPRLSTPRTLTITNLGPYSVEGFTIAFSPGLTGGASYTTTCTNPLPEGTCTVTISPGSTTSTVALAPVINTMTISGFNSTNAPTSAITTLTYGSLYGSGYVFSIDDTPPPSMPMGLVKVAETVDQSMGIVWDGDPKCFVNCTSSTNATSLTDGYYYQPGTTTYDTSGNTYLIWNVLTNTAVIDQLLTSYAAGLCISDSNGPSNPGWYLPTICELGYFATGKSSGCGLLASPSLQNMQSNLVDVDPYGSIANALTSAPYGYWSSNEESLNDSWFETFSTDGTNSEQLHVAKYSTFSVRCVRAFIP